MEPELSPEETKALADTTIPLRSVLLYLPEYLRNMGELHAAELVTHVLRRQSRIQINIKNGRPAFAGLAKEG